MHKAIADDRVRHRIVREGEAIEVEGGKQRVLLGRVASKGLSDEQRGRFFAVIETSGGEAFHVPLDRRAAEELRKGDVVSFATRPEAAVRAVDREIAEAARTGDGVCVARSADGGPHPHARRLRELERLGLATRVTPEVWKVPANLVEALERRARDRPPRHWLLVRKEPLPLEQQVRCAGPTWLDRLAPASLAGFGFGAELRPLVVARQEALGRMGIAPDDVRREGKLRELERRAVAAAVAARTRQVFVVDVANGFRGRAALADVNAPGSRYVVVSDGARFALLPASASLRAALGHGVTLTRDETGRQAIRSVRGKDIG